MRVTVPARDLPQGDRIQPKIKNDPGEEQHRQDGAVVPKAIGADRSRQNPERHHANQRPRHPTRKRAAEIPE
jgi:hypothetical protein